MEETEAVLTHAPDGDKSPLERIEVALARIEAAARQRLGDEQDLLVRHSALRATVEETLGDLDALIARSAP